MILSVRFTNAAEEELDAIAEYTATNWGVDKAISYVRSIERRAQWIADNPEIGRKRPEIGRMVRSFPEGVHIIFYRIEPDQIVVLRIAHRASDFLSGWEEIS